VFGEFAVLDMFHEFDVFVVLGCWIMIGVFDLLKNSETIAQKCSRCHHMQVTPMRRSRR